MGRIFFILTGFTFGLLVAGTTEAQAQTAAHCVSVNYEDYQWGDDREMAVVRNNCSQSIYVIYCGDMYGSSRRCGDGDGSATFYTHSNNLGPGAVFDVMIYRNGDFSWGACPGTISFRNDGHFSDDRNGTYYCLRG